MFPVKGDGMLFDLIEDFEQLVRLGRSLRRMAAQLLDRTQCFPSGLGALLDTHPGAPSRFRTALH
jgi:hypothetical protein